ncbi:MAG: Lacal_2735 family protein [Psychroserpens sp.]|uniref:Lacal_2735 family protein n=1 Tax=Psychroserpens sp. TaxID=2020870 RepID=UPI003C7853B1
MSTHFCKVGRSRPSQSKVFSLKDLEERYVRFIEEAYNIQQTDMSLSDLLCYEARKLKQQILNLKRTIAQDFDAAL